MKTLILMKLAVLAFLSLDARAGVISAPQMRPFDEVLTEFKDRVAKNELPSDVAEAGMNQMEIWTQSGGKVKGHRFDLATVNRGESLGALLFKREISDSDPELEEAIARISTLESALEEANTELAKHRAPLSGVDEPPPSTENASDSPEAATSLASSDFQSVAVPGLSTSEPDPSGSEVETPPASEDDSGSGNNESSEVPSASPKGGRRRGA